MTHNQMRPKVKLQIDERFLPDEIDETSQKNSITLDYWNTMSIWNNRLKSSTTVCDAINVLSKVEDSVNTHKLHKVTKLSAELKNDIIVFGTKKRKLKHLKTTNVNTANHLDSSSSKLYII